MLNFYLNKKINVEFLFEWKLMLNLYLNNKINVELLFE